MSKENNIRYLTANTPPADDNSNKVPTTEWVQEKLDDVEAAVSGGMFPTVSAATGGNTLGSAPSGGTWWCYYHSTSKTINGTYAGGQSLGVSAFMVLCIKIA